jgi:hypothetical protein
VNVGARISEAASENPLVLVGAAFALGLLTGLLLPVTETERRSVGAIHDSLVEQAKDLAGDAVEHGKRIVRETAIAAAASAFTSTRGTA